MRISFLFRNIFTIALVVTIVNVLYQFSNKQLKNAYMEIASVKVKNIVTQIVNKTVQDNLVDHDPIYIEKDNVSSYQVDKINQLLVNTNKSLLDAMNHLEVEKYEDIIEPSLSKKYPSSSIVYEIPFSLIYNNVLFNHIGPKLPVKMALIGDVISTCSYKVESFGINNALVTIYIDLCINIATYLPSVSEVDPVKVSSPISMNLVQGEVPSYMIGTHSIEGVNEVITENEVRI